MLFLRPTSILLVTGMFLACTSASNAATFNAGDYFVESTPEKILCEQAYCSLLDLKDTFLINGIEPAPVKINSIEETFRKEFLSKQENGVAQTTINLYLLTQASSDLDVYSILGSRAEITLGELYAVLQTPRLDSIMQVTHTNETKELFAFVKNTQGQLRKVMLYWTGEERGWTISSSSISADKDGNWTVNFGGSSRNLFFLAHS